ncbi:hypothetical protein AAG570_001384 [Ranatra chinensis]|uniref:Uncharacterized protein n=1 Tax=Ranatra chinensis TaxID=642074 RepID=A0ABD0YY48_9HEMI
MASKRRNMFHKNKTQETTEEGRCNLPPFCDCMSCRPSDISLFNNTARQAKIVGKYSRFTYKLYKTIANIWFNKQCLSLNITPKYAKIKIKNKSLSANRAIKLAEKSWVKFEIRSLHAKKEYINHTLYKTHLELTTFLDPQSLVDFTENVKSRARIEIERKFNSMKNKIDRLNKTNTDITPTPPTHAFHPRLVNLTKIGFSKTESQMLEKGLNHNLKCPINTRTVESLIIDAETAIQKLPEPLRDEARVDVSRAIRNLPMTNNTLTHKLEARTTINIRKKLTENDALITRADKGRTELYCDNPQSLRLKMASKRRNMFHKNKTQETTEEGCVREGPPRRVNPRAILKGHRATFPEEREVQRSRLPGTGG